MGKGSVIVRVFIAVKRHHDHSNSYKGNISLGLVDSFRGLVQYHGGEHGGWKYNGMQAGMVLESSIS